MTEPNRRNAETAAIREVVREDADYLWVRCDCSMHPGGEAFGLEHGSGHCCDAAHDQPPGLTRYARPPVWNASYVTHYDGLETDPPPGAYAAWQAAYEAGAASRQGEVDRLRKVLEMLEIDLVDPITGNCDICKQSNIYGRHWECGFAELEKTGG